MRISKESIVQRSSSTRVCGCVREGLVNAEPEERASPEPEVEVPAKKRRASVDPSDKVRVKRSQDGRKPKQLQIEVENPGHGSAEATVGDGLRKPAMGGSHA